MTYFISLRRSRTLGSGLDFESAELEILEEVKRGEISPDDPTTRGNSIPLTFELSVEASSSSLIGRVRSRDENRQQSSR